MPPARPGPWTEDGLTEDERDAGAPRRPRTRRAPPRASSARRRTGSCRGAASPRCPIVPSASPSAAAEEVSTTRGTPAPRRGAHRRLGAADVDVEERRRVGRAHRVDPGDVVGERAARHPAAIAASSSTSPRTTRAPRAATPARTRPSARARRPRRRAATSRFGERAADQAAPARHEGAAHAPALLGDHRGQRADQVVRRGPDRDRGGGEHRPLVDVQAADLVARAAGSRA